MLPHEVYDGLPGAFSPIPNTKLPVVSGDNTINDDIAISHDTSNRDVSSSKILVTSPKSPSLSRNGHCTPSADIPTIPPHHPTIKTAIKPRPQATLSEDDFIHQFRLPDAVYIEKPGKHTIHAAWQTYLSKNNYLSSFLPLRGTERDRYRPIIEEAQAEEAEVHDAALETFEVLQATTRVISYLRNMYLLPEPPQRSGSRSLPTNTRYVQDSALFQRGYIKLDRYFASLQRESRHDRQYPALMKGSFMTPFGVLKAHVALPPEPWYMGHRPGDPICRIRSRPTEVDRFFFVPELAGSEDGDENETHAVRFEGIVPFNSQELYQRFTRHALPAFIRMVIAAIGFDPRDPRHKSHLRMKDIEHMQTWEFEEVSEREKARSLKLLRRIWDVKYGTDTNKYPRFLKAQMATSMSCLREMGWLMSKLEREAPGRVSHHYWNHCKGLLQDFTGRDAALLAQEYFDITLAAEAEEMLKDGDVDDILLYQQSRKAREKAKVRRVFVGFDPMFKMI
ncbi:hypothetical protein HD806DRAFT_512380 [Xylariaceae sp. AK1471]|nr:hypothetical protein HD806DRAFT_512380 [Xylariaceae sp. AK1471]